jgi:hypothetical protein
MWVGGYDINLIWLILLCFVLVMVVFNGLIDLCEDALPVVVVEAFRHGEEINRSISRNLSNVYNTCLQVRISFLGGGVGSIQAWGRRSIDQSVPVYPRCVVRISFLAVLVLGSV